MRARSYWVARVGKMFLSKLITGQDLSSVQLDDFDDSHLEDSSIGEDSAREGEHIELPTGKWASLSSSGSAPEIGADEEALLGAFDRMGTMDLPNFEKALHLLWIVAGQLSELAYANIRLVKDARGAHTGQ